MILFVNGKISHIYNTLEQSRDSYELPHASVLAPSTKHLQLSDDLTTKINLYISIYLHSYICYPLSYTEGTLSTILLLCYFLLTLLF